MICDSNATTVDLSSFSLARFEADTWRKPWSGTEYVLASNFGHKF